MFQRLTSIFLSAVFFTGLVLSSVAANAAVEPEKDSSLVVQLARRMVMLQNVSPTPSLGYQLSSYMVHRNQQLSRGQGIMGNESKRSARKRSRIQPSS